MRTDEIIVILLTASVQVGDLTVIDVKLWHRCGYGFWLIRCLKFNESFFSPIEILKVRGPNFLADQQFLKQN